MEITLDAHTAFTQAKAEGHAIRVWEDEAGTVLISPTVLSMLDTQEAHPSQEAHPPMQNFKRKRSILVFKNVTRNRRRERKEQKKYMNK